MLRLNAQKLEKTLRERIDKDIAEGTLIGASSAIIQGDDRICTVIRGVSDPVTMKPLQENNVFRLASMSKLITIAGLLQQIERGKLTYDTKISGFFPGFKEKWIAHLDENDQIVMDCKATTPITVHHLVTHTSGLGSGIAGNSQWQNASDEHKATVTSIVDFYQNEGILDFEPGSRWAYSGLAAFDIMGRIIELLSGMEFAEYIKKHILEPLEMKDMTYAPTNEQWKRMVAMHDSKDEKAVALDWGKAIGPGIPTTNPIAGGGLVSTLYDYCRFIKMLINKGVYNGRRILAEDSVMAMGTQRIPDGLDGTTLGTTWGVGCMIYKNYRPMPSGCFGWSGAWGTHMWVDPANKIGAVYMRNSYFAGGALAETARNFEKDVYAAIE